MFHAKLTLAEANSREVLWVLFIPILREDRLLWPDPSPVRLCSGCS